MEYLVFTKEEFGDNWELEEAGDQPAAERLVTVAWRSGREVKLAVEVPFSVDVKVGQPGEAPKKPRRTSADKTSQNDPEVKDGEDSQDKPEVD